MAYKVKASDLTSIRLNETDVVTSVLQNVAIILQTWEGTSPNYRGFGLSPGFIDKPIPVAKAMLISEVREKVEQFEPRATVTGVTFAEDPQDPGKLIPTVEVEINE